jgi:uncharacterized YccA/Bax inhibitor family protein
MKDKMYQQASNDVLDGDMAQAGAITERMTVSGSINKSLILGAIMLVTAAFAFTSPSPLFMWGGAIGGLIVVLIASFRPQYSPTLAPLYAGLEGLFVGAISAIYASAFDGIVVQAVSLTMAVFFLMLFIYKSGIIKVTNKFRTGVVMATGAIFVVYLLSWVLGMFGINIPYLHEGGFIGIGISLVIVGVAALNLLLDFDNFEKGEQYGAPKYMEWFSAMGLLVTLVWLYIEILRLIAIFSSND